MAQTKASILTVATEWQSGHGGISTVNRELCKAWADCGHQVWCYLPSYTTGELEDAKSANVTLVKPPPSAELVGIGEREALMLPPQTQGGDQVALGPGFIVGHGHITGPCALILAQLYFSEAHLVHVVHTAASHLAPHKRLQGDSPEVDGRVQSEAAIIEHAAAVVAVGPVLQAYAEQLTRQRVERIKATPIFGFVPYLPPPAIELDPPSSPVVTIIGRLDDTQVKGLPLLIRAMTKVGQQCRLHTDIVELRLRGLSGEPQRLSSDWTEWNRQMENRVRIDQRGFTSDSHLLAQDLRASTVVVMPSPEEGFGLVALEALAMSVPVLVSERSGMGRWLRESVKRAGASIRDAAEKLIVPMDGGDDEQTDRWAAAITAVLLDPEQAFGRVRELRAQLAATGLWPEKGACSLLEEVRQAVDGRNGAAAAIVPPSASSAGDTPGSQRGPAQSGAKPPPQGVATTVESEMPELYRVDQHNAHRRSLSEIGQDTGGALLVYLAGGEPGDRLADGRLMVGPGQLDDETVLDNMRGVWQLRRLRQLWIEDPSMSPRALIAAYGPPRDRHILAAVAIDVNGWTSPDLHDGSGLYWIPILRGKGLNFHGLRNAPLADDVRFGAFRWQLFIWVDADGVVQHPPQ